MNAAANRQGAGFQRVERGLQAEDLRLILGRHTSPMAGNGDKAGNADQAA